MPFSILGQQLVQGLQIDQIRFVIARQRHSSDRATAEALGISPNTVKDWKYKGVPIDEAARAMVADGLEAALWIQRTNIIKAMLIKVAGLNSQDERVRQAVATELIEWSLRAMDLCEFDESVDERE